MQLVHLQVLKKDSRDRYLARVVPLIMGKTRHEAWAILNDARDRYLAEKRQEVQEKHPDAADGYKVKILFQRVERDLALISIATLYQLYPYVPNYGEGVVPPKGGPYDWSTAERLRFEEDGGSDRVRGGQLTLRAFERNRKHVTVSVEGFDKPVKLKTKAIKNDHRSWLPHVFGYVTIDDVEYVFAPSTNDLIRYSDEEKIDEGKPWRMVGEPRPLDEWQIERRARTAKRRATQLTKAEKAYLDEQVIEAIRVYERIYKRSTQSPRLRDIALYWSSEGMGEPFEWPGEPSEAASAARDYHGSFRMSVIRNSLNRLLRKELISKGDTARGAPSEYWIRVPYDGG